MIVALEPPAAIQADPRSLYHSAVEDRIAGRPAQAVSKLEQVLSATPDDLDARLNLGLALLALGRLDEAETALRRVVSGAPTYADAWVGLARIEQRRGDLDAARALVADGRRIAPDNADLIALDAALRPEPSGRLDLSVSRSRLSGGLPDWTEARLSASKRIDAAWTVGAAGEATRRFGDTDVYLEARAERTFQGGSTYMAVGGAPDADYRPEIGVALGGRLNLTAGLDATLDASAARYPSGVVTGLHPGLAADVADGRLQLAARWINVWDEQGAYRDGYVALAHWLMTPRLALRAGVSDAPESSDGVTVDVTAWSAGVDVGLTDRLILRFGHLSEDRTAYDRREVSIGLGWRF